MPIEYEYRYHQIRVTENGIETRFDKSSIREKLQEEGAVKHGDWLFRVQVFQNSHLTTSPYIRVRDEGHRVTLTYKVHGAGKFVDESEIDISDFDTGVAILLGLGCEKKYYYEKIREIWHLNDVEICFDTNPGRPDIMEIEAKTKRALTNMVKLLGLKDVPHDEITDNQMYDENFGIIMPKNIDLTFQSVKRVLGEHCTKNKTEFNKLVASQLREYQRVKSEMA